MKKMFILTMVLSCCALVVQTGGQDLMGTQNAVLEGVQLSSEPGTETGEKVVSCYFIFRDKPSGFFYEIKDKEKKLVFEFNDVKLGAAPVESMSEEPIKGFKVEERKVDVNAEIRGLEPEWHSVVSVTFELNQIPILTVNEEFSVVSFSYKWCTDPNKCEKYIKKDNKKKAVIIGGLAGAAVVGGGVAIAVIVSGGEPPPEEPQPLPTGDLPQHTPR